MDLTDLPDVRNRIRKGLATFFMIRKEIFANGKISRATKRVAYLTLVVMVALYGCESWAVTVEIERTFRSFHTSCAGDVRSIKTTNAGGAHLYIFLA